MLSVIGFMTMFVVAVEQAEGCTTGLNPDWTVPKTGTVAVEANEMIGVGKARLKRGRGASPLNVTGGERLSGEARGGVRGAYGWEDTGIPTVG